jgi:hypothetical protein
MISCLKSQVTVTISSLADFHFLLPAVAHFLCESSSVATTGENWSASATSPNPSQPLSALGSSYCQAGEPARALAHLRLHFVSTQFGNTSVMIMDATDKEESIGNTDMILGLAMRCAPLFGVLKWLRAFEIRQCHQSMYIR